MVVLGMGKLGGRGQLSLDTSREVKEQQAADTQSVQVNRECCHLEQGAEA